MNHPNLTFITTGLARGGAEQQVVLLAVSLKERGWGVNVISMLPPVAHMADLNRAHIPVLNLNMRPGIPDPRAVLACARKLRSTRPEIVHSHMVHANLLSRVSRLLVRIPVLVSTAHNICEGHRWRDWAYSLTDFLCDLTTNVCQAGSERYIRDGLAPSNKMLWVPNGLVTGEFAPSAARRVEVRRRMHWNGRFVWLAVGNLREQKDYGTLVAAVAHLRAQGEDPLVAVAGGGNLEAELKRQSRSLGLESNIRWLGSRDDVPDLMQGADAFVMSSAWEGTPIALLEAGASHLPAVVTDAGGNREVVEHERTGFLVPPRNPAALANAMRRVLALDFEQRRLMGEQAAARIERLYGAAAVVDRWEHIYGRLLEAASARSRVRTGLNLHRSWVQWNKS